MAKANTVAEALDAIYERRGELDPEEVVRVARNENSILHSHFTWDDDLAAHAHRITQARELIRKVKVRIPTPEGSEAEFYRVRAWHAASNIGRDAPGYVPEGEIRLNPTERALLLRSMEREWISMQRRYEHLEEFWALVLNAHNGRKAG